MSKGWLKDRLFRLVHNDGKPLAVSNRAHVECMRCGKRRHSHKTYLLKKGWLLLQQSVLCPSCHQRLKRAQQRRP